MECMPPYRSGKKPAIRSLTVGTMNKNFLNGLSIIYKRTKTKIPSAWRVNPLPLTELPESWKEAHERQSPGQGK